MEAQQGCPWKPHPPTTVSLSQTSIGLLVVVCSISGRFSAKKILKVRSVGQGPEGFHLDPRFLNCRSCFRLLGSSWCSQMSTGLLYTLLGLGTVMFFGAVLLLKVCGQLELGKGGVTRNQQSLRGGTTSSSSNSG